MIVKFKNKKGFSLVEISIVILIIGLLVAGISKATDMIFDAEVKSARSMTRGSKINRISSLALWLETSLTESIKDSLRNDATTITEWRDINPQSTAKLYFKPTNTPKFLANGVNSLPGVRLTTVAGTPVVPDSFLPYISDSSSTVATFPSTQIFSSGAYATIFVVAKVVASTEALNFCEYASSTFTCAAGKEVKISFDSTGKISFSFPSAAATTATITSTNSFSSREAVIISALKNSGGNRLFVDGANAQTTAVANTNATMTPFAGTFRVGVSTAASSFNIYEILVFNSNLSDDDRWTVESYLSKKYGIAVSKVVAP